MSRISSQLLWGDGTFEEFYSLGKSMRPIWGEQCLVYMYHNWDFLIGRSDILLKREIQTEAEARP